MPTPDRVIYRYEIPLDDDWHDVPHGDVVLVTAERMTDGNAVEVWVAHTRPLDGRVVSLRIFGTGHPIPFGNAVHVGSTLSGPFVWHVYAITEQGRS